MGFAFDKTPLILPVRSVGRAREAGHLPVAFIRAAKKVPGGGRRVVERVIVGSSEGCSSRAGEILSGLNRARSGRVSDGGPWCRGVYRGGHKGYISRVVKTAKQSGIDCAWSDRKG